MKRVAITQRVEVVQSYGERRDCLDQQWALQLETLGLLAVPVPNTLMDPAGWCRALGVEGLILSGGNDFAHSPDPNRPAPERDRTEAALLDWAADLPVLGVCRGFQMLNFHLGGRQARFDGHVSARHSLINMAPDDAVVGGAVAGVAKVNSFHDWAFTSDMLADPLVPLLRAEDGTIEAARHRLFPWVGIMWHPERERGFCAADRQLFRNVFQLETI